MPSQPGETSAHDLRNGLQILNGLIAEAESANPVFAFIEDLRSVQARMIAALTKIEVANGRRGVAALLTIPRDLPLHEDWDLIPRPAEADRTSLPGQPVEDG